MPTSTEQPSVVAAAATIWRDRVTDNSPLAAADLAGFVPAYYAHVAADDIEDRKAEDLYGAAHSHAELAVRRTPGTALVRVLSPTLATHGWDSDRTVVEVVTDDMPFLVDSVCAELTRHDLAIQLIVHPMLHVRRDAVGTLLALSTAEDPDVVRESFIHVEITRIPTAESLEPLRNDLRRVLEDVRAAVEDWPKMQARATEVIHSLGAEPPLGMPADEVTEGRDLLTWMAQGSFTFLGYRQYTLSADRETLESMPGTGLGLLRDAGLAPVTLDLSRLPAEARAKALDQRLLILTKANSRSTVHRPAYLDYVGVKVFDADGRPCGERRFLGLFSFSAYRKSVMSIPVIRRKVRTVVEQAGFGEASHDWRDLLSILEGYPRDELFQMTEDELFQTSMGILALQERRKVRLFVRRDAYGRFVSCLLFVPRERYTTAVRLRLQALLVEAFGGTSVDHTVSLSESVLARLHFVVRTEARIPSHVDLHDLESRLERATHSWDDLLAEAIVAEVGVDRAGPLLERYGTGFPEAYKEDFPVQSAVRDLLRLEGVEPEGIDLALYRPLGGQPGERRFKVFTTGRPISLSTVMPLLADMGVDVTDERPYGVERAGADDGWVYDFGLTFDVDVPDDDQMRKVFQECFAAVWSGRAESDAFNALVLRAGLAWRQIVVLRAYCKYLRQTASAFSEAYISSTLVRNPDLARLLVHLFESRFDPVATGGRDPESRLVEDFEAGLDSVASLDEDRILRAFLALVQATWRTNFFQGKDYVSFKLDPMRVPELPLPRPKFEIFVYSPRVEGVHLRFGPVARGGLRWSDRREDFRTEVLGLVKAQMVKNSVIVPVGSKGGFVVKRPPAEREAYMAEGIECYKTFVRGLLDVTDNLVDGLVVPPPMVIRHDDDDPYLVVAADKGTATFSDIANGVAIDYGFWLGDAFASGGSAGYDHKAMGITARGAWESVKRHFRELGVDVQSQLFTAVGIGDMSGDVFGNGMLLSPMTQLVAAFDHRHIFLDPSPDAAASFAERQRLFDLPRSSWDDYNRELVSAGGGIFARTLKSIPISPEVGAVLGIEVETLTPAELMRAILLAPVDLLWNGGIGTYVKASVESNAEVGDKANDSIRVNGAQLRCKVVGEGGNLGCTQRGRVEFALTGGHINTDAIDNSAGVDTSDHEVNIKILLGSAIARGTLAEGDRNALLAEMTDEVAAHVLRDNYEQNVTLGNARAQAASMLPVHARVMHSLEASGDLDRSLEFLPSETVIAERAAAGVGLTSPELAVLLAYSKITLTRELLDSDVPEDPYLGRELALYFPERLRERFRAEMDGHRLRRDIVATAVVNHMVNQAGISFAHRMIEETAATAPDIARAHAVARSVFGMREFWRGVEALDNTVPTSVQTTVILESRRLVERATRWLLHNRRAPLDVTATIDSLLPGVRSVEEALGDLLVGDDRLEMLARVDEASRQGIPLPLAQKLAGFDYVYSALDIVDVCLRTSREVAEVAPAYFTVDATLELHRLRDRIERLPRSDRWQTLARAALRDDLYAAHAALTAEVLASTTSPDAPEHRMATWQHANATTVERVRQVLADIAADETYDLSTLSVALRQIRSLTASSG